ncbi:MAG TPA: hypothetical protein PKD70_06365 [Saprospiraceae bacterium]|nr:hypothetical protein [Saprospiraceae bacterium]HMP13482.1 hypothetical protein [Saprospiraceae bacterium]
MTKIKLLDLCCGAGLAADGYMQAAQKLGLQLEITGVDIKFQKNYPYTFVQSDAVQFVAEVDWTKYDCVHASPPCQAYSHSTAMFRNKGRKYPDILEPIQEALKKSGLPAVLENVPAAPIRRDVVLVGYAFGLPIVKKRFFELYNWWMLAPIMPQTSKQVKKGDFATVVGKGHKNPKHLCKVPGLTIKEKWRAALGTNRVELSYSEMAEGFPPAYTAYIGETLFLHVTKNCFFMRFPSEKRGF